MRWKTYFFFTRSERRGIGVLMGIILILIGVRLSLSHYVAAHPNLQPLQEQIAYGDSLYQQDSLKRIISFSAKKRNFTQSYPNQSYAAHSSSFESYPKKSHVIKTRDPVELNSADTTRLKQLRGIGSGYARMIVGYRKRLGGFYHKEQLLEVYHFSRETFEKIEAQLLIDTSLIVPLKINELSLEELKRHPYIRYFQAKSLVENRAKRPDGRYHGIEDIVLDQDVTEEFLEKIQPYLSFE